MLPLINSGGFLASAMPASTNPQFATGPQKCTVRGPVGESISALNLDPRDPALAAMPPRPPTGDSRAGAAELDGSAHGRHRGLRASVTSAGRDGEPRHVNTASALTHDNRDGQCLGSLPSL